MNKTLLLLTTLLAVTQFSKANLLEGLLGATSISRIGLQEKIEETYSGDPIAVYFYSPSCPHCKNFTPITTKVVQMLHENSIPIKMYKVIATGEYYIENYNIHAFPTVVVFFEGAEVSRMPADIPRNEQALYEYLKSQSVDLLKQAGAFSDN